MTRCVKEAGIGFMMAPIYHPAMKIVGPVRKKLKVKTVFNILGPMLNPARVPYAVVGVYKEDLVSHSPHNDSNIKYLLILCAIQVSKSPFLFSLLGGRLCHKLCRCLIFRGSSC